jgi:DNA-binding NarL/FixJ family response regulator
MQQKNIQAPKSVLIVEDDAITRRMLGLAIESEPTLQLAASLENVQTALAWLEVNKVDVLLTDLGLPDGSGIEVVVACAKRYPSCDMMVITMASDEENVLASIEAGASGYVLKDAGKLDVVRSVKDLCAGGAPMSPAIARMVLQRVRQDKSQDKNNNQKLILNTSDEQPALTKRETTILGLIARGDSYGEVAELLSVSVGTVQSHIKNIYGKLAVHSRGEAVFEAHRRGLLSGVLGDKPKQ